MYSCRRVCCIWVTCNKPLMSPPSTILPKIFTAMLVVENSSQDPVLSWGAEVVPCFHHWQSLAIICSSLGWRWECLFFENVRGFRQSPSPGSVLVKQYWENSTPLKAWASSCLWSSVTYFLLSVPVWLLEPHFNYGLCQKYLLLFEPYLSLFRWMPHDLLFWRMPEE